MNNDEIREWINVNLLTKKEIIEKYGVKPSYFDVSVTRGKLTPFIRKGVNLYLKNDVEKFINSLNSINKSNI